MYLKLASKMWQANHTYGSYHRFVRHNARETIIKSRRMNDGTIPGKVFKKIQWYMVEAIIMGEIVSNLTGHPIDQKDRERLIYLGALMALFDAMIDDFKMEKKVLTDILVNSFNQSDRISSGNGTPVENMYSLYLDKLIEIVDKDLWLRLFQYLDFVKFQIQSESQMREDIKEESVMNITKGKGGVLVILCSAILFPVNEKLKNALYELGGFIQMMNDCQDIYKDTVAGIRTFVHFSKSYSEIFNMLNEQRKTTFQLIKSLDYPCRGRSETIFNLNAMFIVISYKLQKFAKASDYMLDFKRIAGMNKKVFRINPFSLSAITSCSMKILRFRFENIENTPEFKFENT